MSTLVQISDPHFGTEQTPVVDALVALVHRLAPEVVVLSGDITQRARRAQFEAAARFVARLGVKTLAIPGNHDIPLFNVLARALHPYANYQRAFGRDLEPQFVSDDFFVVCVNTTRPGRHKDGEVSAEQVARICARLQSARDEQVRIVVTHQPVHVIDAHDVENLLHGHEQAIREWSAAGADVIMGGHIHLPYVRLLNGTHAQLARRIWTVQAGTAVSHRVRGGIPNSVNVIHHTPAERRCVVERWDFREETSAFDRVGSETAVLDR